MIVLVWLTAAMRRVVYGGERACYHLGCDALDREVVRALESGGTAICTHARPLTKPQETPTR